MTSYIEIVAFNIVGFERLIEVLAAQTRFPSKAP